MKRILHIWLIILLLLPAWARAQYGSWMPLCQVRFGLRVGTNTSRITGLPAQQGVTYRYQPGYEAGIMVEVPLTRVISLQHGLTWREKGFSESHDQSITLRNTHHYLETDLVARVNFGRDKKPGWILLGGGYFGYWLGGTNQKMENEQVISEKISFYQDDGVRRPDLGFVVGTGITVPLDKWGFQLDLRYQRGLLGLVNYAECEWKKGNARAMNNSIFSLGVTITLDP